MEEPQIAADPENAAPTDENAANKQKSSRKLKVHCIKVKKDTEVNLPGEIEPIGGAAKTYVNTIVDHLLKRFQTELYMDASVPGKVVKSGNKRVRKLRVFNDHTCRSILAKIAADFPSLSLDSVFKLDDFEEGSLKPPSLPKKAISEATIRRMAKSVAPSTSTQSHTDMCKILKHLVRRVVELARRINDPSHKMLDPESLITAYYHVSGGHMIFNEEIPKKRKKQGKTSEEGESSSSEEEDEEEEEEEDEELPLPPPLEEEEEDAGDDEVEDEEMDTTE